MNNNYKKWPDWTKTGHTDAILAALERIERHLTRIAENCEPENEWDVWQADAWARSRETPFKPGDIQIDDIV